MELEKPQIVEIKNLRVEAQGVKSFYFKHKLNAKPGQFIMLWIPGLDEKPFSVSAQDNEGFWVTVSEVGKFTKQLCSLKKGDSIGIRGPYGNSFTFCGQNLLIVGGGVGIAPLNFLYQEARASNFNVDIVIGAQSKKRLIFRKSFSQDGLYKEYDMLLSTDDGTAGQKGFSTQMLEKILINKKIDTVYACGPEKMLKAVLEIAEKYDVECQLSLERYMKCGIGLCGQCCMDHTGARVCAEGPVFSKSELTNIDELGKYKREKSGKKVII